MTQTEYENQTGPARRMPIGSVTVEKFHVYSSTYKFAGRTYQTRFYDLFLFGSYGWNYRTKEGSDILYVMDEDGNCRSPSCFREPL